MHIPLRIFAVSTFILGLACGEHEGDAPGECTDGADNDRDGFFDCDAQDCVFSPDCEDGGPDSGDTGDTGSTGGDDPDPRLLELQGVTVDYTLEIVFSLPVFGVEDCDMVYEGTGDQRVDAAGLRVTFQGTWRKTGGTCPAELEPIVWTAGGAADQSFVFGPDMATLDAWVAHEKADGHSTEESAKPNWYITDMGSNYAHGNPSVTYTLEEPVPDIQGTLFHNVSVRFDK